jgi:hypothetical protein
VGPPWPRTPLDRFDCVVHVSTSAFWQRLTAQNGAWWTGDRQVKLNVDSWSGYYTLQSLLQSLQINLQLVWQSAPMCDLQNPCQSRSTIAATTMQCSTLQLNGG